MNKANATSADVAQLAGVSQSTVSRSYDPNSRISKSTRQKVFAAAEKLHYQVNKAAQTMINKRSDLVGLVTAGLGDPFRSEFLNSLVLAVQEKGLRPMIIDVTDEQMLDQQLQTLLQYQLSGVIITSGTPSEAVANAFIARGTPVVLVNRADHSSEADIINFDNEAAGRLAAQEFVAAGKHKVMVVRSKVSSYSSVMRSNGFKGALLEPMRDSSIQVEERFCELGDYDSGIIFGKELIASGGMPDGIFFCMDYIACGFIDAIKHSGVYSIPRDVAIIGCDDITIARYQAYALTTIRQSAKEMASSAVSALQARLDHPSAPPIQQKIGAAVIFRHSFVPNH
ncbi:MAG: LacI family DNA-binding transcriptional regulator [Oceanospirillaceae bacterium]|nr:LacI family DNA-binding transcriptional regulator [Oceanospirillaceae bacterium]